MNNNKLFAIIFSGISLVWWFFCYCFGIGGIRIWGSFCLQYIWEFALGFISAEAFYKHKKYNLNNYLLLVLAVLGIGLQAFLALYNGALKIFNDIPALVGYSSLALLLSNISVVKNLCHKVSYYSYEYYLIHNLVFITAFRLLKPQGLLIQCIVSGVAMAIALGAAYFYNKIIKIISSRKNKFQYVEQIN